MEPSRRALILSVVLFILLVVLGVWWYFGFSVDFMRFFAAEEVPTTTRIVTETVTPTKGDNRSCNAPQGCTCEYVQCVQAPCDPIIVCPSGIVQSQVSCSPLTQTVAVGAQAVVTASGGAGLYTWYAPGGTPPGASDGSVPGAQFRVSYSMPGIKKVTTQSARVVNGYNDPANPIIDSVACTVIVQ